MYKPIALNAVLNFPASFIGLFLSHVTHCFPLNYRGRPGTDFPHEALRKNVMQRLFDVVDTYVGNIRPDEAMESLTIVVNRK